MTISSSCILVIVFGFDLTGLMKRTGLIGMKKGSEMSIPDQRLDQLRVGGPDIT